MSIRCSMVDCRDDIIAYRGLFTKMSIKGSMVDCRDDIIAYRGLYQIRRTCWHRACHPTILSAVRAIAKTRWYQKSAVADARRYSRLRTLIKVVALYVSASAQMFEREFAKIARRRHRNTDAVAGTTLHSSIIVGYPCGSGWGSWRVRDIHGAQRKPGIIMC